MGVLTVSNPVLINSGLTNLLKVLIDSPRDIYDKVSLAGS